MGVTGSCGLQAVAWGPVAGMRNGVLVFCAQNVEVEREREGQRMMESSDNGLLHKHAQACACIQKPLWEPRPPATPGLQLTTHKPVPQGRLPYPTECHPYSPYEDCYSWDLIIAFAMSNLHICIAHLLPALFGTSWKLDQEKLEGEAACMLDKHSTTEPGPSFSLMDSSQAPGSSVPRALLYIYF